jgi:hypothetical protein
LALVSDLIHVLEMHLASALVLMLVLMLDSYKICAMEMHLVSSLVS